MYELWEAVELKYVAALKLTRDPACNFFRGLVQVRAYSSVIFAHSWISSVQELVHLLLSMGEFLDAWV